MSLSNRSETARLRSSSCENSSKQGIAPATIVTDKLGSYSFALRQLGVSRRQHDRGRWKNNRADNPISHCDNENDE